MLLIVTYASIAMYPVLHCMTVWVYCGAMLDKWYMVHDSCVISYVVPYIFNLAVYLYLILYFYYKNTSHIIELLWNKWCTSIAKLTELP